MILEYKLRIDTDKGTFTIVDLKSNIEKSINSIIDNKGPIAVLKDRSLSFNYEAIELMNFSPRDKIAIVYDNDGNPIIGKEEFLGKKGNLLSKYNSIFCSGFNNKKILEKGKIFYIEKINENIFRLTTIKNKEKEKVEKIIPKQEVDLSDIIPEDNRSESEKELDDLLKEIEDVDNEKEDNSIEGFKFVI